MSSSTVMTSNRIATIWPPGAKDKFGRMTSGVPYTVNCCFVSAGSKTFVDDKGNEFTPQVVIYYEADGNGLPKVGGYVALGDHAMMDHNEVKSAVEIKSSELQDCSLLGEDDDYQVAG